MLLPRMGARKWSRKSESCRRRDEDERERRENMREQTRGDGGRRERTRGKGRVREGRWAWPNLSHEVKKGGSSRGAVQGFICIAVLQGSSQQKFSLAMQILNAANAISCRRLVLDVHARAGSPSLSPSDWNQRGGFQKLVRGIKNDEINTRGHEFCSNIMPR